jgi:hypothetical protein
MFDPDDKPDDDSELPEHEDELPADALAQLVATFGQDEETRRLLQQFPTDDPGVPWDMSTNKSTDIDKDIAYDNRPELRTIALDKRKYNTQRRAEIRIREICLARGERIHQMFETALHWVARVYAWRVP